MYTPLSSPPQPPPPRLTNAILGPIVLLGELVTVVQEEFPPPHVDHAPQSKVAVVVVLSVHLPSLWTDTAPNTSGSTHFTTSTFVHVYV